MVVGHDACANPKREAQTPEVVWESRLLMNPEVGLLSSMRDKSCRVQSLAAEVVELGLSVLLSVPITYLLSPRCALHLPRQSPAPGLLKVFLWAPKSFGPPSSKPQA